MRDKHCAHHCALGYQIDDGRLWRIGDGKSARARARLECVTQEEAVQLAKVHHTEGGHFGRDLIKIVLLDNICSPWSDKSIMTAITKCSKCKAFGGLHLAALLKPITRQHPWELMVSDYLSMPLGKGGFHTIGLYMDVYSQKIFGFKITTFGTTATTISVLDQTRCTYRMPEVFMVDGGSHFACHNVAEWCALHGSRYQQVAAYRQSDLDLDSIATYESRMYVHTTNTHHHCRSQRVPLHLVSVLVRTLSALAKICP